MANSPPSTNDNIRSYRGLEYDPNDPKYAGLSKNAVKRLLKEELWKTTRVERNRQQKEKDKRKRAARHLLVQQGLAEPSSKKQKKHDAVLGNRQVVFDCAFSSYMSPKEINSMTDQLMLSYGSNRSGKESMKMFVTSLDTPLKDAMNEKTPSWTKWKNFEASEEPFEEKFEKSKLIYLSADSENVAHELEEDKIYIIGGIVDKNRHKGLCQNKAAERGIQTARLPIEEYIQMASRKVLTVNQVYNIMVKWVEYRDWEKAFMETIPGRKLKDSQLVSEKSADTGVSNDGSKTKSITKIDTAVENDNTKDGKADVHEEASDTK